MRSLHDLTLRPRRWSRALALALVLPLVSCATGDGQPDASPPAGAPTRAGGTASAAADVRAELRVDGRSRTYLLHRPASADGPRPLVIAFHGRGSHAAELREQSALEKAARRARHAGRLSGGHRRRVGQPARRRPRGVPTPASTCGSPRR
ncbi:hypothetical protein R2F25_18315 [Streptomyces sp. UP1A-1]|nr:hypothetical protein [Streptomyces sp. UP1A-1]